VRGSGEGAERGLKKKKNGPTATWKEEQPVRNGGTFHSKSVGGGKSKELKNFLLVLTSTERKLPPYCKPSLWFAGVKKKKKRWMQGEQKKVEIRHVGS